MAYERIAYDFCALYGEGVTADAAEVKKLVRRLYFITLFTITLMGFASLPGAAQSGRTFYIDSDSGSNSNAGTKASPWKTHPYMQTSGACSGTGKAPAYSHAAGDQFIFKGGVTWPSACFPFNITAGGSSASLPDVYTVDQTWFSGGSFARPIFAGQNATMPYNSAVAGQAMVAITASNVTLGTSTIARAGFDIGGQNLGSYNASKCGSFVVAVGDGSNPSGVKNVIVSQSILHDWITTSAAQNANYGHNAGGMCYASDGNISAGANVALDHSEVRDDGNVVNGASMPFGACGKSISIQYSTCHYLFEGIVGFLAVHDSEFGNLNYPNSADSLNSSGAHVNTIEADVFNGDGPIYNNYIHDAKTYGEVIDAGCSSPIYNNVISNVTNAAIRVDGSSCTSFVANNTIDVTNGTNLGSQGVSCMQHDPGVSIQGGNNICIVGGAANGGAGALGGSTNYVMSANEASTYGFTSGNRYFPSSSNPNVVGKGTNLVSTLSAASTSAVNYDTAGAPWFGRSPVARTSSWDLGAYVINGQSSNQTGSKPNPPNSLSAIVQ